MTESSGTIRVFSDLDALSRAAARTLRAHVDTTLETRDRYRLALAGGSTPKRLYELLAAEPQMPWDRIHLFWGDERFVPHDHPESNARLAATALIDHVPVPDANVHRIPTDTDTRDAAATAYTATLQQFFPSRTETFDTVLLGLGSDGHTASLFPETDSLQEDSRWARVVSAPSRHDVSTRISCTLPVLNGARQALFLVAGARKREALQRVLDQHDSTLPATHVAPREDCLWYVDQEARPQDDAG